MASPMESKALLRMAMLDRRQHLPASEQKDAEDRVVQYLQNSPGLKPWTHWGIYWSFKNELSTRKIFSHLNKRGKELYLPRLNTQNQKLEFAKVDNEKDLLRGSFGVWEPAPQQPPVPLSSLQVILIPGVAFDIHGSRMGWGKGLYDRLLQKISGVRIGLAYDFQVLERIPTDAWDEKVDLIITDRRVITCDPKAVTP